MVVHWNKSVPCNEKVQRGSKKQKKKKNKNKKNIRNQNKTTSEHPNQDGEPT